MDQVDDHLGGLAVDLLFARPVEVELFEGVLFADPERAAGSVDDLYRVAVVDDPQR